MSIRKEGHIDPIKDEKKIRREVEKEMQRMGLHAERTILDYFQKHNIDDRGDLAKSVYSEVKTTLKRIQLQFGTNAKHGIFVHDGTKPHWAPIKALEKWVVRKLGMSFPEAGQVARKIQLKIAKKGTKAKPYAAVTMRLLQRTAPMKIEAAIARGIRIAS